MNIANQQKKVVLVVEDEQSLSRALGLRLAMEGYSIVSAANGETGLKAALEHKPALILLDILMPVMDGTTMLKKLREDEWGKTARVIILTNVGSDPSKLADAIEENVGEYLVKTDMSLEQIVEKVREKIQS